MPSYNREASLRYPCSGVRRAVSLEDRQGIARSGEETRQAYTPLQTFRQVFLPHGLAGLFSSQARGTSLALARARG